MHIPKDLRSKFDAKSQVCIYLGPCTNPTTFKLYNITTKRIIHSRDVIFEETKFGLSFSSSASTSTLSSQFHVSFVDDPPVDSVSSLVPPAVPANIPSITLQVVLPSLPGSHKPPHTTASELVVAGRNPVNVTPSGESAPSDIDDGNEMHSVEFL